MRRNLIAVLVFAAGLAACDDVGGNDTTELTIMLTDAPAVVLEAVVTISEIYLQGGEDEEPGGRVVLRDQPVTTNLLTLVNDLQTLVDEALVPSGTYAQLRFVIGGAYLVVDEVGGPQTYATPDYTEAPPQVDGTLECPSCGETGIKVSMPGGLELDGTAATLIVDFDVEDSFGQVAGQTSMWIMHPSLTAVEPAS